jgi:hypothetical protein
VPAHQGFKPALGNGTRPEAGAEQGACDRPVGVGVTREVHYPLDAGTEVFRVEQASQSQAGGVDGPTPRHVVIRAQGREDVPCVLTVPIVLRQGE